VLFGLGAVLLVRTRFGQALFAIGGNENPACWPEPPSARPAQDDVSPFRQNPSVSLTGRTTLILAIVLAAAMPAITLYAWNRFGTSSSRAAVVRRWSGRAALVLGSQLTAVAMVAVLVNDAGNFYSSWLELFGEKHTVRHVVARPGNEDTQLRTKLAQARAQGRGLTTRISIRGSRPDFGTFSALVYLPMQYGMPEYAHRTFPVVELIAGSPGTPQTWTKSLAVARILDREMAAGRSSPFIAVMPSQDVAGRRDTQCVDVVHGPNVERYLTVDVRSATTRAFRASTQSREWALMGYSSGGFCAINLTMRNPRLFSVAVSIAGNMRPAHDHQTGELFGRNRLLRDQNTPIWRAVALSPPNVALLLMSSAKDTTTSRDAADLAAAARSPLSVALLTLRRGGHNFEVWRAEEPVAFAWVSAHLTAPLAPPPVVDNTQPVVVTS
jgi:enterochelin esterase-like enzyme